MPDPSAANPIARLRHRWTAPLILELDLSDGIAEEPPADPVSALLTMRRPRLADVLAGLRTARSDDRVKVLIAKIGGRRLGLAGVQELRDAIQKFGRAGKLSIAWADTMGEFAPGNVQYLLATAFSKIYLQPSGDVGLTGISLEQWFYRNALDRLGLDIQVGKRHEYKSAADRFTEDSLAGPAREAIQRVAESLTGQLAAAVATRLGIPSAQAQSLIDRGPFLASEALDTGLVDALGYRDEVYADARKAAGPDPCLLYLSRYQRAKALARRARSLPSAGEPAVGLIYATGPIRRGRSGRGPLTGGVMGSDTIAAAIRQAAADHRIKAIVLRVNSPGGSYVASDSIWREVVRARQGGTPVVVSMGDVAASGGYFISMAADAIVAQPATLTGSIGVLGGKPDLSRMLERAGVTPDGVAAGAHAGMFTVARAFSDDEWERVNSWLDHVYDDFTGKVAEGRGMTREQVDEAARGRVWTGADAAGIGLVDKLGGLADAVVLARTSAGLPESAPLRAYPHVRPLERLRPPASSDDHAAARARVFGESWGPVWRLAADAGLPPFGPLLLPGQWLVR